MIESAFYDFTALHNSFLCFLRMINVQLFLVKNYFHFYSSRIDAGPRGKLLLKFCQNIGCHSVLSFFFTHTFFSLKRHWKNIFSTFSTFQEYSNKFNWKKWLHYSLGQYWFAPCAVHKQRLQPKKYFDKKIFILIKAELKERIEMWLAVFRFHFDFPMT